MKRIFAAVIAGASLWPGPGPASSTHIHHSAPAQWSSFSTGAQSRLAILLTDTTAPWLPLAHGLRSIGVPFVITRDYHAALTHHVVLVYPIISGRTMSEDALSALTKYQGTLIATNVLIGGMGETFGFGEAVPSRTRKTLTFSADAIPRFGLDDPRESTLRAPASYGYTKATHPLAAFDDGTAAITVHGHAYALGVDLGALLQTGYGGHDETLARGYDNGFEPTIDVWLRVIGRLYVESEPNAVTLGTVPDGKPLAVMITHDVDYARSVDNSRAYLDFEKSAGIPATYFVQTKYIRDYNDDVFFNDQKAPTIRELHAAGMELASHSVAHSRQFGTMPVGTGDERYPSYHPFVQNATLTTGASVLGELRISKYLLESVAPGDTVTAFRPGYLAEPRALPQALAAVGYRFSSSTTANSSLTHLPFALTDDRAGEAESGIFEFPVSIEDEAPPRMDARLADALDVARRVGRYGGEMVVLIHPNVTDYKLKFEQGFVTALKPTAWFGTVSTYGRWWAARDGVTCDVTADGGTVTLKITSPQAIDGLPITVPATWTYVTADPGVQVRPAAAHAITVRVPAGAARIVFRSEPGGQAQ